MTRRNRITYHVYDMAMVIIFTGTEREIVEHFKLDKMRARWAINQTVEIEGKYIIDTRVDDPNELIFNITYKRGSYNKCVYSK